MKQELTDQAPEQNIVPRPRITPQLSQLEGNGDLEKAQPTNERHHGLNEAQFGNLHSVGIRQSVGMVAEAVWNLHEHRDCSAQERAKLARAMLARVSRSNDLDKAAI